MRSEFACAFGLIAEGLGQVRRQAHVDGPYEEICTCIKHIRGVRVMVWTRIPDGMTPADLGRRFFAPYVDMGPELQ